MLSYDSPVAVNGQTPTSPTNASTSAHNSVPPSPKTIRPPTASMGSVATDNASATSAALANIQRSPEDHHIWLVTGPAGCGKSTVARHIAEWINIPYIEGDEFHPQTNIDKMSNGIPLTDSDRWDWLTILREECLRRLNEGNYGVVLTCSALKRKYRDVIRVAPYYSPNLHLHFIYLHAPEEVLVQRVLARAGHFMSAEMVHSQFEALEPPTPEETDVINVDVTRPVEVVEQDALDKVLQTMDIVSERRGSVSQ